MTKAAVRQQGITRISVQGYKSLRARHDLDIRPLTIIAGVNSSGKSSALQPLLLLKQTLDASYDPGPLLLDGPHVSVTAIEQVLSKAQVRAVQEKNFSIRVEVGSDIYAMKYGKDSRGDLRVLEMSWLFAQDQAELVSIREEMSSKEIIERFPWLLGGPAELLGKEYQPTVQRKRCFLEVEFWHRSEPRANATLLGSYLVTDVLEREVSRIIHLPALRGNPRRTYRTAAVADRYPGPFDTYTAGVIAAWQN